MCHNKYVNIVNILHIYVNLSIFKKIMESSLILFSFINTQCAKLSQSTNEPNPDGKYFSLGLAKMEGYA